MRAGRGCGVLEAHRGVQGAAADAGHEVVGGAFAQVDLDVGLGCGEVGRGGGKQRGERARERADAQLRRSSRELSELGAGEFDAVGKRGRVLEQPLPATVKRTPPRSRCMSLRPSLTLERRDLLRHRRLRQRKLLCGSRERLLSRYLAEGDQAPRVELHQPILCIARKQNCA